MTDSQEFEGMMADCLIQAGNPPFPLKIAIAVSGGSDSMALCHLVHQWSHGLDIHITALIVDHGLRKNSNEEARWVAETLGGWGVNAEILKDEAVTIAKNIQSEARNLRYRLIRDWCNSHDVTLFFTAHHQQDQAETFLLRLGRGSGLKGLSSMHLVEARDGTLLIRPLLNWSKAKIMDYVQRHKLDYIDDPSNQNDRFDRVKIRKALPVFEEVGLSPERLAQTAHRLAGLDHLMDCLAVDFTRKSTDLWALGMLRVDRVSFSELHREIGFRCLQQWFQKITGSDYSPRAEKLDRLLALLQVGQAEDVKNQITTLGGCRIQMRKDCFFIIPNRQRAQQDALLPLDGFVREAPVDIDQNMIQSRFEEAGDDWKSCAFQDEACVNDWKKQDLPASVMRNIPVMVMDNEKKIWPDIRKNRLIWRKNDREFRFHALLQDYYGD